MAPIAVNPDKILEFQDPKSFYEWLGEHRDTADEVWIKIHKVSSGVKSISPKEANDVALCWGWIDGVRKSHDHRSYLQRYTPRRKRSLRSQVNVDNVTRLIREGRMTVHGLKEVNAAKADGRWDHAYGSGKAVKIPNDLQAAIDAEPEAKRMLEGLSEQNRFAVVAQGARNTRQLIAVLHEEANPDLPAAARTALQPLAAMLLGIETQIAKLDKAILAAHRSDPISVRLATIPGIGPIVASCLSASVPDASLFQGSREFAAYLGLVPRQHSTGGKARLGSISKMGNRHLRKLLVVGAHAALYSMKSGKTRTALADWARSLLAKKPFKVVAVALANKMARIAWAVMARSTAYEPGSQGAAASAA